MKNTLVVTDEQKQSVRDAIKAIGQAIEHGKRDLAEICKLEEERWLEIREIESNGDDASLEIKIWGKSHNEAKQLEMDIQEHEDALRFLTRINLR